MSNKIVLSLGALALLVSSIYACPQGNCGGPQQGMQCNQMMGKNQNAQCCGPKMNNMKPNKNNKKRDRIVAVMMHLDLSEAQRTNMRSIMVQYRTNQQRLSDAFSENSFNKAQYIKIKEQKRDNKIEKQAEMIEKMYNILTPAQKKELKTRLDAKKPMRKAQ